MSRKLALNISIGHLLWWTREYAAETDAFNGSWQVRRYRFIANVRCLARLESEVELPTLAVCLCIFVHIFIRPSSGQSKQHMVAAWPGSEARSPGASPGGSPASPSFGKTLARTGAGAAHPSSPSSPAAGSPGSSGAPSPRAAALPSRTSDMAQRTDFVKSHFADFMKVYSVAMGASSPPLSHKFPLSQLAHFSLLFGLGSSFSVQYVDTAHALCSAGGGSGSLSAQQLSTLITRELTVNDLLANSSSAARQGIASPPVHAPGDTRASGHATAGEASTVLPTVISSQGRSMLAIWGDHVLSSSGTVRSVRGSTGGSLAATTTVADEAASRDTQPDLDLRMEGCVESKLYALRPMRFANVRGSSRCTVVLGAVQRVATFEALQSCTVIVAAARVRVINCVDCHFYVWCTSPPSIVGDCREITLAPFNVHYPSLESHLKAADLMPQESSALAAGPAASGAAATPLPTSARWKAPRVVAMASEGGAPKPYLIMPPRDWSMTVVPSVCPSSDQDLAFSPLLPVPGEYEQANEVAHFSGLAALRSAISSSGMSEDGMAEVQTAVQAHFREWLVSCPEGRDVADMVRIHRYARVHAQAIASAAGSSEGKHDGAHK